MPRMARVVLAHCAHHVVQRRHNRSGQCFSEEQDYRYCLDNLAEWKERLDCKVHALLSEMANHEPLNADAGGRARGMAASRGWLYGITARDPAGNVVLDYQYPEYDRVGNVMGRDTEHGAYTFGYDALYRLTQADDPGCRDEVVYRRVPCGD